MLMPVVLKLDGTFAHMSSCVCSSERKAFGCQTARFTDCVDALPGPGTYFSPTDLLRRNHGVGRKGYGALTSASKRWAGDAPRYTGPGPGAAANVIC